MTRPACTGCGRRDIELRAFECDWPDGRKTLERHCPSCASLWQPQLRGLGATLHEVGATPPRLSLIPSSKRKRRR